MKFTSNFLKEVGLPILMIFVFTVTVVELLVTLNCGIWADYPVWMIGVVLAFVLSSLCLARFLRKMLTS